MSQDGYVAGSDPWYPDEGGGDGTLDGYDPAQDSWITWSKIILWFTGAAYVLMGVVFAPIMFLDPEMPLAGAVVFALMMFVLCGVFGGVNFVAAWGLGRRAKWAWIMTIVIGGIYAPSACVLFGAVLLYAMLKEDTRTAFLR